MGRRQRLALILALCPGLFASGPMPSVEASARPTLQIWAAQNEAKEGLVSSAEARRDAVAFDLIVANTDRYRGRLGEMRSANPEVQILAYVMGTFSWKVHDPGTTYPDAWYLKDSRGRHVRMRGSGHYLMDPGNAGWVEDRVQTCRTFTRDSGYEGCMFDMLGVGAISSTVTAAPVNPRTRKEWTDQEWHEAVTQLAGAARRSEAGLIFGNGLRSGQQYFSSTAPSARLLDELDSGVAEAWVRGGGQPIDSFKAEAAWRQDVDMLVDAEARGHGILTLVKVWTTGTAQQKAAWHQYSLATFMLGAGGRSRFGFSSGPGDRPYNAHDWWKITVGDPMRAYATKDGVYWRDFQRGKVVVNPRATAGDIVLDRAYLDVHGNRFEGRVSLAPRQGLLLRTPPTTSLDAACPSSRTPPPGYDDVSSNNPHGRGIACLAWYEIVRGTSDRRFEPNGQVTRDQMASFVARFIERSGRTLPPSTDQGFGDIRGNVHEDRINQLAAAGIVRGVDEGSFAPSRPVSRAQMATFIVAAFDASTRPGLPGGPDSFTDDQDSAHERNINAAAAAAFATGTSADRYSPDATVLRGQMASFLARALDELVRRGVLTPPS